MPCYYLCMQPFYDPSSGVPPDPSHVTFLMSTAHEEVTIWNELGDRECTVELTKWAITEGTSTIRLVISPGLWSLDRARMMAPHTHFLSCLWLCVPLTKFSTLFLCPP